MEWAAALAVIAGVALWVHLYLFGAAPLWDSAAFLTIGKLQQQGLLLYRDLWDTKPPGIYAYQRLVFSVLPAAVWSLRLTDCALYVAGGLLFYGLCRRAAGWPLAVAATAAWLFLSHHPEFAAAGFYTEEYAALCAIAAVAAAAHYRAGGRDWAALASGAATAAAVLFKHPGAACAMPALVLLSARRPRRAVALFAAAAAAPLIAVVGWFAAHGALAALLDCQIWSLLSQHGVTGAEAPPFSLVALARESAAHLGGRPLLLLPAAIGVIAALWRPDRLRLAAVLWLAADLLLIAAQRFYSPHYFILAFPSLLLLSTIGAAALLEPSPGEPRAARLARALLAGVAVAGLWPLVEGTVARRQMTVAESWARLRGAASEWPRDPGGPFEMQLGLVLREQTPDGAHIFVFDTGSAVAAYWTADRLPASRYIFSKQVLASPARQAEQLAELARTPPAAVVVLGRPAEYHFSPWLRAGYRLDRVMELYTQRAEIWLPLGRTGDGGLESGETPPAPRPRM